MSIHRYLESPTGAIISPCAKYRYALWRQWSDLAPVGFIGLNPSTADATMDDPTIRRCIGFAKRLGGGGLVMLNLFAYRSTNPKALGERASSIVLGPQNDEMLKVWMPACRYTIAAWGASVPSDLGFQISSVSGMAVDAVGGLFCLGKTKEGAPRHPLYLKKNAPLSVWCGNPKRPEVVAC